MNSICAGLNSKCGMTILVGCTLKVDENKNRIPIIESVSNRYSYQN